MQIYTDFIVPPSGYRSEHLPLAMQPYTVNQYLKLCSNLIN